MNDQSEITAETALALPDHDQLPAFFQRGEIDEILTRIETEALAVAPDLSTAKGRKEVASLAHKIARSKTALDNAGKTLTEEARRQLDAVNAERRKVRDRLDDLKVKVRKPLDDWEQAEEDRKAAHRARLALFAKDRLDWQASSADLESLVAEIEAVDIDDAWDEFQELAREAKAEALGKYRADLKAAQTREEQEKELAALREERRAQEERERAAEAERREAEEAKNRQKRLANETTDYIKRVEAGFIGNASQPLGVLIYELESKIVVDDRLGEYADMVEDVRQSALRTLRADLEQKQKAEAARQEREKQEAEERARAQAAAEEAARKEAEETARKKREANARHRNKVLREIGAAVADIPTADLPQAMLDGNIPHVQVVL